MPRIARIVIAGVPHHVTQRGNRRENVFFSQQDRLLYLRWLKEYCNKWNVDVLAYCLMNNHVDLVLRPASDDGLERVLKPLHMRYAQYINRIKGWKGHLWQGRFFSSPLDEAYTYCAIRYVERNPVRANMVDNAEDYRWSSAASRAGLRKNSLLVPLNEIGLDLNVTSWREWLSITDDQSEIDILRSRSYKGQPCGNSNFIKAIEAKLGKTIYLRSQGRPRKR